jgi:hypothetical protein
VQDTWVLSYDMVSLNVLLNRVLHVREPRPRGLSGHPAWCLCPSIQRTRASKGEQEVYCTYDEATHTHVQTGRHQGGGPLTLVRMMCSPSQIKAPQNRQVWQNRASQK